VVIEDGEILSVGARLAVSISLMFEGGGQPISGAAGIIPDHIDKGVPDLPAAQNRIRSVVR
jgi:hypothetical protein